MNIDAAGRADSWENFVRVLEDARLRTQAPITGFSRTAVPAKSPGKIASRPLLPLTTEVRGFAAPKASLSKVQTKIAGNFFDAYA